MVAPYTGASASPQPDEAGTAILIPVTNAVERLRVAGRESAALRTERAARLAFSLAVAATAAAGWLAAARY